MIFSAHFTKQKSSQQRKQRTANFVPVCGSVPKINYAKMQDKQKNSGSCRTFAVRCKAIFHAGWSHHFFFSRQVTSYVFRWNRANTTKEEEKLATDRSTSRLANYYNLEML